MLALHGQAKVGIMDLVVQGIYQTGDAAMPTRAARDAGARAAVAAVLGGELIDGHDLPALGGGGEAGPHEGVVVLGPVVGVLVAVQVVRDRTSVV